MNHPIIWRAVWLPISLALLAGSVAGLLFGLGHPVWGALFLFGSCILLFDVNGRVRDLKYLLSLPPRRRLYLFGRYMRTACGRQVMIAVEPRAAEAYYGYGYRWYHILPDGTFTRSSPFINANFWRQLFSGHRN